MVEDIVYSLINTVKAGVQKIDTDWFSEDRKTVKDYLYSKKGLYCCDIVTFNTIALKGAIRDIVRGLYNINASKLDIPQDLSDRIKAWEKSPKDKHLGMPDKDLGMPPDLEKEFSDIYKKQATYKEIPYDYLKFSSQLIDLAEQDEEAARKKYERVFKYVDLANGVVVSVGNHPAGVVVSPYPVDEWFGTFTTSTNEYPISLLNMKEIDALNFVKLDILGLT